MDEVNLFVCRSKDVREFMSPKDAGRLPTNARLFKFTLTTLTNPPTTPHDTPYQVLGNVIQGS